jgi:lactoylglutathione lyase
MKAPALSLLVLRTAKMEATREFYRALGLELNQEQHGSGPIHFSCEVGNTILEIYPGGNGAAPERKSGGATMLGFSVNSLDALLSVLTTQATQVITEPKDSPWGRRAVVLDPDGRAVELSELRPE